MSAHNPPAGATFGRFSTGFAIGSLFIAACFRAVSAEAALPATVSRRSSICSPPAATPADNRRKPRLSITPSSVAPAWAVR